MSDLWQVIVVTLAAAGAGLMLVRTYLPGRDSPRTKGAKRSSSSCASCASAPDHQRD